jgi:hypothetical protein
MSNNSSSQSCKKCGNPRVHKGKFCVKCGTRFADLVIELESIDAKDVVDSTVPTTIEEPRQAETAPIQRTSFISFNQGTSLIKYLRKNQSIVLIGVGTVSIIGAIAFTLLMLIPKDLISGIEVPPIEGMIFDLFVVLGLLAILIKEGAVLLGYLPKKSTLDRWFSFVLLLVFWVNLITFSLGLVEKSIFLDLGLSFSLIFLLLTIQNIFPSFIYFRRYEENIFSGILTINLVSVLYLFQWIIPADPMLYTITICFLVILVIVIALKWKDIVPFIGISILLPLIFLSPYLLSNSVVILVLLIFNLFPFIEALLRNYMSQDSDYSISILTIGQLTSPLGILTTCFAVFYGYLEPSISIILFAIPVFGFMGLKAIRPIFRKNQLTDFVIIIFLLFSTIFLDLSLGNSPVLLGVSILLTIQAIVLIIEILQTRQQVNKSIYTFLLLISLMTVSLTSIEFIWKILVVLIPLMSVFFLITRKIAVNHKQVQFIVFGVEIMFVLSFIRTPQIDWIIVPASLVLAFLGLCTFVFFHRTRQVEEYSLDIIIFSVIFEAILLVIMVWTQTSIEMLFPVVILIVFTGILLLAQVQRRVTTEFRWINASFLVCFGLMTFWNEFDEIITLTTTFLLMLPIMIDLIQSRGINKSSSISGSPKIFNLNLSLSGIGLSLIIFFEEFSPINHGLIYLIVIITWLGMYFSARNSLGSLSAITILILPGIIFFFELLLHETIFTPITEISYLFVTISVLLVPPILLQIDESFLKKETTKITVTPLLLGVTVITILSVLAFAIYEFNQQESAIIIAGISIGIIITTLFIKYQYESGLVLVISSIPPLFYLVNLDILSYLFYLLPLLPILVNFLVGFQYLKTSLSIRLQELIIIGYLVLFILLDPVQTIVYSTTLVSVFLFSWQIFGIIKRKHDKMSFILTNTINSGLMCGLIFLLDPLPQDLYVLGIPVSFILILVILSITFILLSTIMHLLYWQFKEIDENFSFLMALTLIFNCSAMIIAYIGLLTKYTDIMLGDILSFTLISTIVLIMLFLFVYMKEFLVKSQISSACLYVTTIWMITSSIHSPTIETVFLWIFFAPIFMIVYLTKRDRSIGLLGLILYLIAGIELFTNTLNFILLGDTEWLTILGFIVYGIEMVTLGIYTSITRKSHIEEVLPGEK